MLSNKRGILLYALLFFPACGSNSAGLNLNKDAARETAFFDRRSNPESSPLDQGIVDRNNPEDSTRGDGLKKEGGVIKDRTIVLSQSSDVGTTMPCGPNEICERATQVCVEYGLKTQTTYYCLPIPTMCANTPHCNCLEQPLCNSIFPICLDKGFHHITCKCSGC
jgi:hypothetical protein